MYHMPRMSTRGLGFEKAKQLARAGARLERGAAREGCVKYAVDHLPDERRPLLVGPPVCVLTRVYKKSLVGMYSMLHSLFATRYAALRIFMLDTFPHERVANWTASSAPEAPIEHAIRVINDCRVFLSPVNDGIKLEDSVLACLANASLSYYRTVFGYDRTDAELQRLLHRNELVPHSERCEYFLITNHDNLYSSHLFDAAMPFMLNRSRVIHFDFTTHQAGWRVYPNKEIDLGAALLHHSVFKIGEPAFLRPELMYLAKGAHGADGSMYDRLRREGVDFHHIAKVLLYHQ